MSYQQSAAETYRANKINSASPLDLLIMAYDAALIGCGQRDLERTTRALNVLRDGLNFDYDAAFAMGLFRLYQWCAELARGGQYEEAASLLRELRDTWAQVKSQTEASQAQPYVAPQAAYRQTRFAAAL